MSAGFSWKWRAIIPFSAEEQDVVRSNKVTRASHGSNGPPEKKTKMNRVKTHTIDKWAREQPNRRKGRSVGPAGWPALKQTPSSHTESDLGALGMDGKIIWRRFQSLAQIIPESTRIIQGSWHPVSVSVLRCRFSVFGLCIVLEPIRGAPRDISTTLGSS